MIQNAQALRPEFVPKDLHHRGGVLDHLADCLKPIRHDNAGETILITGPSGAGKTTLARYICGQLERDTLGVRTGEVNCLRHSSPSGAINTLLRDVNLALDAPTTSRGLHRLEDADDHLILIIDEVADLSDPSILTEFHDSTGITPIFICIDGDRFLNDLDPRIRSRVRSAASVHLDKFRHQELVDIITARVDVGLRDNAITPEAIGAVADQAAGNARYAIATLRQAARDSTVDQITPDVVDAVSDDAREHADQRAINQFSTHHQLLLEIVREHGSIPATRLRQVYEDRAQNPKAESTRVRYLGTLLEYGFIIKHGNTKDARYEYQPPSRVQPAAN